MYKNKASEPLSEKPSQLQAEKHLAIRAKGLNVQTTLAAIGDILIHDRVYENAKIKSSYDFHPMFQMIQSSLKKPDILLANQETILGGVKLGLSSYPCFNSPQQVGNALIDSGVDIVSTANNHALDRGEKGLITSINYLNKLNLPHVGTYTSQKSHDTLQILSSNGIKIAYLSYTYGTNGIPIPKGKDFLVNLIDKTKMKEEIQRAKKKADVVVMSVHWGIEYQRFPNKEQKQLASFLVNQGVDIIFGHHPHVLQPMAWIKAKDGRKALVVYSLGNFLSGQDRDYKDIGGMASVQITKKVSQEGKIISLNSPTFLPTYVSHSHDQYRVVPLKNAGPYGLMNASEKYNEIMNHMTHHLK